VASCDIVIPEHVKGRNVIVVEDIVDSGVTMAQFMKDIKSLNPESVALMTLLFKPDSLRENVKVDYVGKAIENRFVVGYGLDYDGLGRNLDAIYVVKE
jgi:hypoxanthine phosphoribosyltransferase